MHIHKPWGFNEGLLVSLPEANLFWRLGNTAGVVSADPVAFFFAAVVYTLTMINTSLNFIPEPFNDIYFNTATKQFHILQNEAPLDCELNWKYSGWFSVTNRRPIWLLKLTGYSLSGQIQLWLIFTHFAELDNFQLLVHFTMSVNYWVNIRQTAQRQHQYLHVLCKSHWHLTLDGKPI